MNGVTLELLVPGLRDALERLPKNARRRFPASMRLLTRSDPEAVSATAPDERLLETFGLGAGEDHDAPVAPFSLLGDGGEPGEDWWMRADPGYLQPDQDRLLLFPPAPGNLTQAAAERCCEALNAHFADRGLAFLCPRPGRWYVRLPQRPRLRTAPLDAVLGRNIHAHLPTGADARHWRALMNEVQMLLHGAGPGSRAGVNTVWFWGAGRLPASLGSAISCVRSNRPTAVGLARCAGLEDGPPPDDADAWLRRRPGGVQVIELAGVPAAAVAEGAGSSALEPFERSWAGPLWRALRAGRLSELRLWPGGGTIFRARPASVWRFWRRGRRVG